MARTRPRTLVLAMALLAGLTAHAAEGAGKNPEVAHGGSLGATVNGDASATGTRPAATPSESSEASRVATTLDLRASLSVASSSASRRFGENCAPGTPASVECFDFRGSGTVRGLGRVSLTSLQFVDTAPEGCPTGNFAVLGGPMRLSVAGKGTIELRLDAAPGCRTLATVLSHTRPYTVVGGTGSYSGATGTGIITRKADFAGQGSSGTDLVRGTLSVPGLDFDLVPPSITGAKSKTVRLPRGAVTARITYSVAARDARDGAIKVTCKPITGSRFRVGRTRVTCKATDDSGNSRVASFWVTVRAS